MKDETQYTVVLAGAGHTHLHLAARAAELISNGIQPILIDPGSFWYSGMAAGLLSGTYPPDDAKVNAEDLIQSQGGRFIRAALTGLDPDAHTVSLSTGDVLSYDALSLNLGSEVPSPFPVQGHHVIPVKPISGLPTIPERIRKAAVGKSGISVAVIGSGATGCEVSVCLASFAAREKISVKLSLISRSKTVLPDMSPGATRSMECILDSAGIRRLHEVTVREVINDTVWFENGVSLQADIILVATGLQPPSFLQGLPLKAGPQHGVLIRNTLQTVDHPELFAVGDCADLQHHPLPRLGVYGVREGPILMKNLIALRSGDSLQEYQPQKRALQILHTGYQRGLFVYGPICFEGRLAFRIKDWIDRRFLDQYR